MKHMSTQSEGLEALAERGFVEQIRMDDAGRLILADDSLPSDQVTVVDILRFEGMSNPDDEAIIMAIRTSDGRCGVLTLPYGPDVSGPQADAIRSLSAQRRSKTKKAW